MMLGAPGGFPYWEVWCRSHRSCVRLAVCFQKAEGRPLYLEKDPEDRPTRATIYSGGNLGVEWFSLC
jgi:hypothetical protein